MAAPHKKGGPFASQPHTSLNHKAGFGQEYFMAAHPLSACAVFEQGGLDSVLFVVMKTC
jgi:hypothetical protein